MRGVTGANIVDQQEYLFQPALPMRGVTKLTRYSRAEDVFQPALPMRGVTRQRLLTIPIRRISTRTPHAGSDLG